MSSDAIHIRDLIVPTHIGWRDEERSEPQSVSIDITLHADLSKAGMSDDLADTVDYDALIHEVETLVRSSETHLLEHLCEEVVHSISRYRLVDRVTVEMHKVSLRLEGVEVGPVSVRIERTFT